MSPAYRNQDTLDVLYPSILQDENIPLGEMQYARNICAPPLWNFRLSLPAHENKIRRFHFRSTKYGRGDIVGHYGTCLGSHSLFGRMPGSQIQKCFLFLSLFFIFDATSFKRRLDVKIPEGALVVDASDKYVMPGIVDAMSYYGIRPLDRNDSTNPVTPQNRIIQAYNPYGDYIKKKGYPTRNKEILCGGVTALYIAPGNRQVIGGQGAVVKTNGNKNDDIILLEPASIDITMGDPVKSAFGAKNQSPMTRMSIAALLRKTLVGAQGYVQKLEAAPPAPPPDLGMEAMARLLRKEIPARFEANLTDDIRTAIRIADEFDLKIVIDGGTGAYELKTMLAEKRIPVVLSPISHPFVSGQPVEYSPELHTLRDERTPALLADAGVKIALASFGYGTGYTGSSYHGRWLLLEAALATGFGLSEEDALKAVTINPAEILGVADRIGSIEPGKDADIIILDGHPLNIKSWVEQVLIEGEVVYKK